jgi:uncharacterized protein (DUF58 family)
MTRGRFRVNARGWVFLALALSVAFSAGLKGNNLLFAVFSVLFGLFAASGILTVLVARKIEASRVLPEAVTAGEVFTVGLRFRNAARLVPAFCLRFEDRLTYEGRPAPLQPTPVWLPSARPGERVRASYFATAHQRGWARLGPFTVVSEFFPGFFTWTRVLPAEDPLLVLPRCGVLNRRIVNTCMARIDYSDAAPTAYLHGDEEFASLREYRPGDSPRRIHWKMSARLQGKLLVREFEDAQVRDAVVLLETFVPNPADARRRMRLERAVTFAATLAEALVAENYRVRFRAFTPDPLTLGIEPHRGALDEFLYELAVLKPTRTHTLADLLAAEESGARDVYFVLRIGHEPLPPSEALRRAVVVDTADMRSLMHVPS